MVCSRYSCHSCFNSSFWAQATGNLFAAQFETRVRYSGLSIATQLAGILGGGIAPLVAAVLVANNGGSPAWVALYLSALALLGLLAVLSMRPTSALDLEPRRAPGTASPLRPAAEYGTPQP